MNAGIKCTILVIVACVTFNVSAVTVINFDGLDANPVLKENFVVTGAGIPSTVTLNNSYIQTGSFPDPGHVNWIDIPFAQKTAPSVATTSLTFSPDFPYFDSFSFRYSSEFALNVYVNGGLSSSFIGMASSTCIPGS